MELQLEQVEVVKAHLVLPQLTRLLNSSMLVYAMAKSTVSPVYSLAQSLTTVSIPVLVSLVCEVYS